MNTWSDCEVADKISFNFIVNSGIFDLSGSVNTNNNYGTIVGEQNFQHTYLINMHDTRKIWPYGLMYNNF